MSAPTASLPAASVAVIGGGPGGLMAAEVLAELTFGMHLDPLRSALIILSGLLTVASAAAYLVAWLRHMSGNGEGNTSGT